MVVKLSSVEDYINTLPLQTKKRVLMLQSIIRGIIPQATEELSYGVPAFKLNGNVVLYAGFKNHIGFYPMPSAMKKFKKLLSTYDTSEGTIRFSLDTPLPIDLIRKIIEFRVQENQKRIIDR